MFGVECRRVSLAWFTRSFIALDDSNGDIRKWQASPSFDHCPHLEFLPFCAFHWMITLSQAYRVPTASREAFFQLRRGTHKCYQNTSPRKSCCCQVCPSPPPLLSLRLGSLFGFPLINPSSLLLLQLLSSSLLFSFPSFVADTATCTFTWENYFFTFVTKSFVINFITWPNHTLINFLHKIDAWMNPLCPSWMEKNGGKSKDLVWDQ